MLQNHYLILMMAGKLMSNDNIVVMNQPKISELNQKWKYENKKYYLWEIILNEQCQT